MAIGYGGNDTANRDITMCIYNYTGSDNDTFICREGTLNSTGDFTNVTYDKNQEITGGV